MLEQIKELRATTNAKLPDCKKALEESNGDMQKAIQILQARGMASGAARIQNSTPSKAKEGFIGSYIHSSGKIGVLVELSCDTDFVARNEQFQALAKDIAMQIAAMNPIAMDRDSLPRELLDTKLAEAKISEAVNAKPDHLHERIIKGIMERWFREVCLMDQPFIREDKKTIKQMVEAASGKLGEAVKIVRFVRMQIGE